MLKIAICGSSKKQMDITILSKTREIGRILGEKGIAVFSGATTGYSFEASKSALCHAGLTIGISPAENYEEHTKVYKLPTDAYKIILFTGLGYKARDIVLIRSIDAVIFIGGGVGTICELCAAIDNEKVIGVLKESGGATLLFDKIAKVSHRVKPEFIYENDPNLLVEKLVEATLERRKDKN